MIHCDIQVHFENTYVQRDIKVEKSDFNIDNMLTTMRQYYRGGRYDFLLNSRRTSTCSASGSSSSR